METRRRFGIVIIPLIYNSNKVIGTGITNDKLELSVMVGIVGFQSRGK